MRIIPANIIAFAKVSYTRTNVWASLQIAQWALESRYGEDVPKGSNNPFGIKAVSSQAFVMESSREENPDGSNYYKVSKFRKFNSIGDAFIAHANLLANGKPYSSCRKYLGKDLNAYIEAFAPIYATDMLYANMLKKLIAEYNLTQYDIKQTIPVAPAITATVATTATIATIVAPHIQNYNFWPLIIGACCFASGIILAKVFTKKLTVSAPVIAQQSGLTQEDIDMAVRSAMEPVITAIAANAQTAAAATAAEATLTEQLATANATIAQMTQDDTDTDAAVANAAGVNADGTPKAA